MYEQAFCYGNLFKAPLGVWVEMALPGPVIKVLFHLADEFEHNGARLGILQKCIR